MPTGPLDRRTFLKGAGSIAIALPLLEEMLPSALGAAPEPPARSITIFFGEGMPTHVQADHLAELSGPLAPLRSVRGKLSFIRGLSLPSVGGAHESGGMCSFVGAPFVSTNRAGGPSIDQVMLQELYPAVPPTPIPTLAMGFYGSYRQSGDFFRRVKSWSNDGSPSEIPKAFPSDLFTRIFGTSVDLEQSAARRKRSVLDSVMAQYRHYTGDASPLGAASKARLHGHLERLRQYEVRAFAEAARCPAPARVVDPPLYGAQESFNGVNLTVDDITAHWRLNVDLFVLALRCDLTRIGVAHFLNVGDRIDLRGDYRYNGELIYTFNDTRDRPAGTAESEAVNHEHFHDWDARGNRIAEHHLHFHMREVAYLLQELDDPAYLDPNGGTLLDNAMVMITTELSEPGAHNVTNIFHAIGGANERFKTGGQVVVANTAGTRPVADLLNTVLRAYGIARTMATGVFTGTTIDAIRR